MNARNHGIDDADIGLAQLERGDVEHTAAGQQKIKRLLVLGGGDCAQPRRHIERFGHTSLQGNTAIPP